MKYWSKPALHMSQASLLINNQSKTQNHVEWSLRTFSLCNVSLVRPHSSSNHWSSKCGPRTIWELARLANYWVPVESETQDGTWESDLTSPLGDSYTLRFAYHCSKHCKVSGPTAPGMPLGLWGGKGQVDMLEWDWSLKMGLCPMWLSLQCLHKQAYMNMQAIGAEFIANETKLDSLTFCFWNS